MRRLQSVWAVALGCAAAFFAAMPASALTEQGIAGYGYFDVVEMDDAPTVVAWRVGPDSTSFVRGYIALCAVCDQYTVLDVREPAPGKRHWCVSGLDFGRGTAVFHIRGNREIAYELGATCATRPDPIRGYQTLQYGRYLVIGGARI